MTNTELKNFKKESRIYNRRFRRRVKRFLGKNKIKKLLHANYVFSMACLIGLTANSTESVEPEIDEIYCLVRASKSDFKDTGSIPSSEFYELLKLFINLAYKAIVRFGNLLWKGLKYIAVILGREPYFGMFMVFASAMTVGFWYLANRFGKKAKNYDILFQWVLYGNLLCILAFLLKFFLGTETARNWYSAVLAFFIYFWEWILNMFKGKKPKPVIPDAKESLKETLTKTGSPDSISPEFTKLVGFSTLLFILGRFLLRKFKLDLVGPVPHQDFVIEFIEEHDLSQYFPNFGKRKLD